jgi:opacity protein-like surface antigen
VASTAWAEDTDDVRFYLGLRLGTATILEEEPVPGLEVAEPTQNLTGISIGVNLGRYWGLEIAGEYHVHDIALPGPGRIGEYGMFALIPQVRLRYPLFNGLLTPYVVGGVGVGFNDFSDRKPEGIGLGIHAQDIEPVAALGGGIEYFVANNIAVGLEAKYLISRDHEIEVEGVVPRAKADLDTLLMSASLRLFFPETQAARRVDAPYPGPGRFYLGARIGGAWPMTSRTVDGVEPRPGNTYLAEHLELTRVLGVAVGVNIGRYWGIELSADGYTPQLAIPDSWKFGKYANYAFIPQLRLLYPLLDGRVTPYLLGGVGVGYAEFAHPKPRAQEVKPVGGRDYGLVASLGVGTDFFVAKNIAVVVETKYLYNRGAELTFMGRTQEANVDALFATLGVRIFFPESRPLWGM